MTVVDEFTARAGSEASVRFRPLDPPIRFKVECVFLEDRPPSKAAEEFIAMIAAIIEEIRAPAGSRQRRLAAASSVRRSDIDPRRLRHPVHPAPVGEPREPQHPRPPLRTPTPTRPPTPPPTHPARHPPVP